VKFEFQELTNPVGWNSVCKEDFLASPYRTVKMFPDFGLFLRLTLSGLLLLCCVLNVPAGAQTPGPQTSPGSGPTLTLLVSVREADGLPLSQQAMVHVSREVGGQNFLAMTQNGAMATFQNIAGGDYDIEVEAAGYKAAHERAEILGTALYTVYVYMTPANATEAVAAVNPQPIMTPKLQKEIERALAAIREQKYGEARQHLLKASNLAPSNPDVEYLMGMLDYFQRNLELAAGHFEKALGFAPAHERSLVSLGRVEMELHQPEKAATSLEKAVLNNSKNAQAHLLLAVCDIKLEKFSKARTEALTAADLDKSKSAIGRLIAAKTYVMENNLEEARKAFTAFIRDYPNDKGATEAKGILERLSKVSSNVSPEPAEIPLPQPQPPAVIEREWAPPDTDDKTPAIAPNLACSTSEIVESVQKHSQLALANFERFGAKEQIDHQEIDGSGIPGPIKSRNFNYIILIQRPKPDFYFIDERRDGEDSLFSFPTSLATRGLVSLGVYIFHPVFSADFNFACEGLGRWGGHPAWQVRFEQKQDVPSRIRTWAYQGKFFPVALKGRIWISPNTFDILHLETDLRNPVKELQLTREHLSIDYGPVAFKQAKEELWLPQSAEMYFSIWGRRYHHKHTLSDYFLFNVDTHSKQSSPPLPKAEQD
jgi:tetratricopeptide (TPR) repeat protein